MCLCLHVFVCVCVLFVRTRYTTSVCMTITNHQLWFVLFSFFCFFLSANDGNCCAPNNFFVRWMSVCVCVRANGYGVARGLAPGLWSLADSNNKRSSTYAYLLMRSKCVRGLFTQNYREPRIQMRGHWTCSTRAQESEKKHPGQIQKCCKTIK